MKAGAEYVYRIKARNSAGLSPQSGYFDADVPQGGSGVPKQSPPQVTVTVSFEEASYDVTEGATATVTVVLDKAPGRDLTIELTSEYAGDASDDDVYGNRADVRVFYQHRDRKVLHLHRRRRQRGRGRRGHHLRLRRLEAAVTAVTAGDPEETTVNFIDRAIIFNRAAVNVIETTVGHTDLHGATLRSALGGSHHHHHLACQRPLHSQPCIPHLHDG